MEDQEDIRLFIKGYEQGYWLKKGNRRELDDIVNRAAENRPYQHGLKLGSKEAQREKARGQIKNAKNQSKGKDKGMEMN